MYNPHDTICAISTPPGESALAIVRLSGNESKSIAESHLGGKNLEDRRATLAEFIDSNGKIIDEVVAVWYKAPRSYTSEEMVEIICHGGYVVSEQILSILCADSTRLAEPGEFTLRAFLNGRLDLTEAEAVNSVIKAKSSKSKQYALNNLEGKLKLKLDNINTRLLNLITILEAEIDFNDEEIDKLEKTKLRSQITDISHLIEGLISTYDIGRIAEGRARISIVGAPNVGKSSIFNKILQANRAIVTSRPGTTRDYLSEYINIGGFPVIVTDTAGIWDSGEDIELLGIEQSKKIIDNSDICLLLVDASRPFTEDDLTIAGLLENIPHLVVANKIDLVDEDSMVSKGEIDKEAVIPTSAKTGEGIPDLIDAIRAALLGKLSETGDGVLLSQRQLNCARQSGEYISQTLEALDQGESEEIIVSVLRESLEQIGLITGRVTSDEILNKIFTKFCIGK